ncbi:hypothetical protein [Caulobacter soli]|uniref:hypothetical protein n=1 Tax=Caulobacter soli TaxID=2708539 RepID=UPI0013EABD45|nr:hypothetical protein [Caulobacter soli]
MLENPQTEIESSDASRSQNPPWDLVLAATVIWAFVTGPAFFAALFVIFFANLSSFDEDFRIKLVLAVPISTAIGAIGALASRLLRERLILVITSTLPFVALVAALVAVATKFL